MNILHRVGLSVMAMMFLSAASASAKVQITNVSLSPRLLMELYQAHQNQATSIPMAAFMMMVSSTHDSELPYMEFKVEIKEGRNQVVMATGFKTIGKLSPGVNTYNANQIDAKSINVTFNDAYQPSSSFSSFS